MYADIKSELKFIVDENGNFTSIEYIGSLDNQTILKKSFELFLKSYAKKSKKIIAAIDENGNSIAKSFYIPYHLKYNRDYINSFN